MAITQDEQQGIISAVLSSIRTNSKTIDQLTPVTSLSETDCFEINGGKRVTYKVLRDLITSLSSSEQDSLRTLINKCELKSASITVAESTATLSISSVGKTITTSIPIATTSSAGLMTATDKVKLQSAYDTAHAAKDTASTAKSKAETALSDVNAINDKIGMEEGIAPLDEYGKIPTRYIPGSMDDVKEFAGTVADVSVMVASASKNSSDEGCAVVYNRTGNTFVLQVANVTGDFVSGQLYYSNWLDADLFGEHGQYGRKPHKDKVYVDVSSNKSYRWSGSDLVAIGSDLALGHTGSTAFPGDEGARLQQEMLEMGKELQSHEFRMDGMGILPFDGTWDGTGDAPRSGVYFCPNDGDGAGFRSFGNCDFHGLTEERYNSGQNGNTGQIYRCEDMLYRILDGQMVELGGASVGNTYNLTAEIPTSDPDRVFYHMTDPADTYYAPSVVLASKKAMLGLQITFAIAKGAWKTYQYIGTSLDAGDVLDKDNWLDLAGMSAGSEPFVNINALCGDRDYTLSLAIQALLDLGESTGIDYRKEGMVMTYRRSSSPSVWETKQYQGALTDLTAINEAQWVDFGNGGGGGTVETKDTPEKDGQDALSTGGAYEMQQNQFAGLEIVPDPTDYIIQGVSKAGNPIGDSVKIPKSNGTGSAGGSTLTIYCDQAVWGAFGSEVSLMVAIKSVSYDGEDEVLGTIRTVSILDPVTGIELWSEVKNERSSTSASDTKFKFDFTGLITSASSRDFIIQATDADGNRRTKTITVTAVDVTCTCIQTLNYSASTALEVGVDRDKSLPMYKFGNNVSTRLGILVTTEMFYNGEWRTLGTATVVDSYSHNISINPCNVFGGGERLGHGAYPVRIQGKDLASGVVGNMVYTAVMSVDPADSSPIVVMRYDDRTGGKVRLYDSISIDVAAYTPGKTGTPAEIMIDGHLATTVNCPVGQTYNVSKQIQGYVADGTKSFDVYAQSGPSRSLAVTLTVEGSAIDASLKEGALFTFDFSTRNNSETDRRIIDNGYEMTLNGCNYNSNGFVNILGETVCRIAENVTAEIPYAPFSSAALESVGAAIQLAFSTRSIKDKNAMLCECYDPASGVGFYIRGNEIVLSVLNGTPRQQRVGFKCGEKITVAVVVEPAAKYVTYQGVNYSFVKLYVNGEECAAIGYQPGTGALRQNRNITFNSADGDFNLNYIMAYNSHMEWLQAFRNYLCKLSDVRAMIAEYDRENVLDTTGKPSMSLMAAKGIPYYVVVADQTTFDNFDYALNGGTSTSDQFACTLYYYNPQHPEVSFKATNVLWRRQGTTSAQRPEKNDRFNFNKKNKTTGLKATVTLLNPDDSTELGRKAILAARHNKVFVHETGHFVDVITVKKDYSDSSMANDCGVCDMMNATFRALGPSYQTPAQRAFDGTQDLGGGDILTGIQLDHSTKNHPIAYFRATTDTLQDAWFQARGNWKEDKGEQTALGFKDTPGYNKGCLNYGDFIEFFGTPGETLAQTEARFKATEGLDTDSVYLISQYCGRDYAIYRCKNGAWTRSTGSMKQVGGKWVVTGDVLNPVSGYELLQYAGMDWWQGVATVEDMMKPTAQKSSWVNKLGLAATEYPAWTYYFECMIDDDQLQEDLALGKKVPYDLFNMLRFFDSCDYSKVTGWEKIWKENAYRYLSLESAMAYTAFTDYLAAVDQRAKNMQPMFFLEDGCSVENGVYSGYKGMEPTRMYLNKVYDCDTCNGGDNDGGRDIDPETDPNKMTDEAAGHINPYMGYGSVLFNNIDRQQECWNSNDLGVTTISLKSVVNRMRNQTAEIDGKTMAPFSPEGARYFFVERRLLFWPKTVATYDCEQKYIYKTHFANMPYFYALHGLGLTSLPRFIEQRWAIRDGYYQTGDFFTNPLSGRVSALSADSRIYITAASTGYFGIGNDASGQLSETVYLEAGQSHAFTDFAHDAGALLYIYQPGRMSRIDLSEMSLAFHFDDLSKLLLAEEIILGGERHTANTSLNGFSPLGSVIAGDLPFLRVFDVSHTTATSIDVSGCPRIESIVADDTGISACNIAQTSPIETLRLPATITSLDLVNLPRLTYPGGLQIESMSKVSSLMLSGCGKIDTTRLVSDIVSVSDIRYIRLPDIRVTAPPRILKSLHDSGAVGLDQNGEAYEESGKCSGLSGRWIMDEYVDKEILDRYIGYFPLLEIHNSQFSTVVFSDDEADSENISNPENKTGFKYSTETSYIPYVPSGHVARIRDTAPVCKASYDRRTGTMTAVPLNVDSLLMFPDGSPFDPKDTLGEGYDVMKYVPRYWYKGVNHFAASEKYLYVSSNEEMPLSTASDVSRIKVLSALAHRDAALLLTSQTVGEEPVVSAYSLTNVYKVNVAGKKLLRWPGINAVTIAMAFTGADGKIISVFSFQNTLSDMISGDYLIAEIPSGAVEAWMTVNKGMDNEEIICTDSDNFESVEPEWLLHEPELIGVYHGYCDRSRQLRSISGANPTHGDGTSTTNPEWEYDADGNLISLMPPSGAMHWTARDLSNAAAIRGDGYQCQDYESWKDFCVMTMAITGTRDMQARCGSGILGAGKVVTGGYDTLNPQGFSTYPSAGGTPPKGNLTWGLQNYYGCGYEYLDNVSMQIESWKLFKRNRYISKPDDPIDYVWHVYDPATQEERTVPSVDTGNGYCISKVRWGRHCDIVCSQTTGDKSLYNQHFADTYTFESTQKGIVQLHSGYNAGIAYGLIYVNASNISSFSDTRNGARLAFRSGVNGSRIVLVEK